MIKIENLREGMKDVQIKLKLTKFDINSSEIKYPDGAIGVIKTFWGEDDTGRLIIIFKNDQIRRVKEGDLVFIKNGIIRMHKGNFTINDGLDDTLDFDVLN